MRSGWSFRRTAGALGTAAGLLVGTGAAGEALAFDCTKAYLAVDYVICADPALISKVDRLQVVWDDLRGKLGEERRKALRDEQRQWIKDYAEQCGVPGRGDLDPTRKDAARSCVADSLDRRVTYLTEIARTEVAGGAPITVPPPAAASKPPPASAPGGGGTAPFARPGNGYEPPKTFEERMMRDAARTVRVDAGPNALSIIGMPPRMAPITGPEWFVFLDGDIDGEASKRLKAFLDLYSVPKGSIVYLNSPGGSLGQGMEIGRLLRAHRASTNIGRLGNGPDVMPAYCLSACATAFLGGRFRYYSAKGAYGVHRFAPRQASAGDGDLAQIVSAQLVTYIRDMGVDTDLFTLMSSAGSDDMIMLPKEMQERLNVVNNGIIPPEWSMESTGSELYLRGTQETIHGIGKALFFCTNGRLLYKPMFSAGSVEDQIHPRAPQSIFIDDETVPLNDYVILPLHLLNSFAQAVYQPPPSLLARIATAKTIGFAVQPANPDFFLGFRMDFAGAREKFSALTKTCR